nr:hypothetical protein [Candidatus Sigynarchaeota archaeon]
MTGEQPGFGTNSRAKSWKEALLGHFLLSGYWMARGAMVRSVLEKKSGKRLVLAGLNVVLVSAFIALGIQGFVDGPDIVRQMLAGNVLVYSQLLLGPAIASFGLIMAIMVLLAFVLPLIFNTIFNLARHRENRVPFGHVFTCSAYCMMSILVFAPLIHVIALIATWQPTLMVHLYTRGYENTIYYVFAGLLLASLVGWAVSTTKMLKFSWARSIAGPAIVFVILLWLVSLLVH